MRKSRRENRSPRPSRRRYWLTAAVLAVLALGVVALFSTTEFNWPEVQRSIAGLNPFLLFAFIAILPVFGFSVGVVYLVAGARFGPLLGGVIVAAATAVHLIATYWISHSFLRTAIERLLARHRHHLPTVPEDEHGAVSAMAALVPGVPYFARNYLLALSGVPFRIYFATCLPIYVARSYVTIFLGDLSSDPSRSKFLILAAVYAVKLGICALLLARMRRRHHERQVRRAAAAKSAPDEKSPAAARRSAGAHLAGSA